MAGLSLVRDYQQCFAASAQLSFLRAFRLQSSGCVGPPNGRRWTTCPLWTCGVLGLRPWRWLAIWRPAPACRALWQPWMPRGRLGRRID